MKKILIYLSAVILLSVGIWSCSRKDTDEAIDRNSETVIFKNPPAVKSEAQKSTSTSKGKSLNLQERITQVSIIKFENDILDEIRDSKDWEDLSNNFSIDKLNIKKTLIVNSQTVLITIPFKSNGESGYFNIYKTGSNIRYTKMSILSKGDGKNNYKITLADNSQLLNIDIDKDMRIYDYAPIVKPSTLSKLMVEAEPAPEPGGGPNCFKNVDSPAAYLNCIKCLIADHCGQDGACFIACALFIEVCLGISALACLGATA